MLRMPISQRLMVLRATPTFSANSGCVRPSFARRALSSSRVMTIRYHRYRSLTSPLLSMKSLHECLCGYFSDPQHECTCTPQQVQRYRAKISGPLLDRIDIQIEVPAVKYKELSHRDAGEDSATIRTRVNQA